MDDKLINFNAAIDVAFDVFPDDEYFREQFVKGIEVLPVVDAVPVVRCRDCKYFEYDHLYIIQGLPIFGHLICNKWGDGCRTDEDGFCFMGERKDGDHHRTDVNQTTGAGRGRE